MIGTIQDAVNKAKAWYQSKTIIGIIIAAIGAVVAAFTQGTVDIAGAVNEVINNSGDLVASADSIWGQVLTTVGLALALWGRIKAKVGIKSIVSSTPEAQLDAIEEAVKK